MAGGKGERFWPKSRADMPKQLLPITGEKTMIQETVDRITSVASLDKTLIITNKVQAKEIAKQLPDIDPKRIIAEPCGRNTAPCIALAAAYISREAGEDAVMVVLPADHVIHDTHAFYKTVNDAVFKAKTDDALFTIGIVPTHPSTGYGYIHFKEEIETQAGGTRFFLVEEFTEKPYLEKAEKFISCGEYFWNSGIFVWKVKSYMDAVKKYMPDLYDGYLKICRAIDEGKDKEVIEKIYPHLPNNSIDYGIMEKVERVIVAKSQFDWDDVGSWDAVEKHFIPDSNGNVVCGNFEEFNSKNCIVSSDKLLVAGVGLENIIIVATDDVVLVCDKSSAQDVKEIVKILKKNPKYKKYL